MIILILMNIKWINISNDNENININNINIINIININNDNVCVILMKY